jgi:hypothetical protein
MFVKLKVPFSIVGFHKVWGKSLYILNLTKADLGGRPPFGGLVKSLID